MHLEHELYTGLDLHGKNFYSIAKHVNQIDMIFTHHNSLSLLSHPENTSAKTTLATLFHRPHFSRLPKFISYANPRWNSRMLPRSGVYVPATTPFTKYNNTTMP